MRHLACLLCVASNQWLSHADAATIRSKSANVSHSGRAILFRLVTLNIRGIIGCKVTQEPFRVYDRVPVNHLHPCLNLWSSLMLSELYQDLLPVREEDCVAFPLYTSSSLKQVHICSNICQIGHHWLCFSHIWDDLCLVCTKGLIKNLAHLSPLALEVISGRATRTHSSPPAPPIRFAGAVFRPVNSVYPPWSDTTLALWVTVVTDVCSILLPFLN